jgi:predicted nucleotidyltransferase
MTMGDRIIDPLEKAILERFKAQVSQEVPVHKMILFGSRARGGADPQSDMDVVVVVAGPVDEKTKDFVSYCAWEAGFERGIVVAPVVFSREEWEYGPERYSLFVLAVEADGVPV